MNGNDAARSPIAARVFSFSSARVCLLAIVALAPVVTTRLIGIAPLTHDAYELPKSVVVWVLAIASLVAWTVASAREQRPVRVSWWLLPVSVYVGWTGLATAFSASPATSLVGAHGRMDGLVTAVAYGAIGFVALQVFTSGRDLVALARATAVSALAVGVYGAMQTLGYDPFFYLQQAEFTAERAFSFLGNPVFLGGYLVLAMPLQLALAISEESRNWRVVASAGVVASTVVLLGTASRTAWVAAVVGIGVLAVAVARKRVRVGTGGWIAIGAAVVAAGAVVVRSLRSGDEVTNVALRFASVFRSGDGSATERALVARSALRAIAERPVFGFGPGRFEMAFRRFRLDEHVARFATNSTTDAHSALLQTATTGGIVASFSWLAAIVWPLVTTARRAFSREAGLQRIVLSGTWAAVLGYGVFLLAGISVVGATAPMWILLGVLAGVGARPANRAPGRWLGVVGWVFAAVLVALVVWSGMLLAADNRYLVARMRVRGAALGNPMPAARAAVRLAPMKVTYLGELAILTAGQDPAIVSEAAEAVLAVEPDDLLAVVLQAEAQAQMGNGDEAVRLLQRAEELAPNDPMVDALRRSLGEGSGDTD